MAMIDNAKNTTTATKRSSKLIFGHGLDWWNGATLIALFFAAASAAAVVLTQYATIRIQTQEANEANLHIASLQKEAADAHLEQERLKATLAWRTLTPGKVSILSTILARHPGAVNVWYVIGDPESAFLAAQYCRVLAEAKWRVSSAAASFTGIAFGITVTDGDTADGQVLMDALHKAVILVSPGPLPPPVFTSGENKINDSPILMIGSKRPAIFP